MVLLRDSYSMKFLCTQVCGIKAFHVWGEEPCLASLEALFPSSRNGPWEKSKYHHPSCSSRRPTKWFASGLGPGSVVPFYKIFFFLQKNSHLWLMTSLAARTEWVFSLLLENSGELCFFVCFCGSSINQESFWAQGKRLSSETHFPKEKGVEGCFCVLLIVIPVSTLFFPKCVRYLSWKNSIVKSFIAPTPQWWQQEAFWSFPPVLFSLS